jgi:alpha-tubulin suppressor-like RCC1 family protein
MRPLQMSTAVLISLIGLLGLACGGDDSNAPPPPPPATSIVFNGGNQQSAALGSAVVTPPSVKVIDASALPVADVAVTFEVASGGGSITGPSQTTDASGIATVGSWTLGPTAGTNTLTATVPGLPSLTFTATGTLTFAAVTAGFVHSCGLTPTGAAYCWGHNFYGQLGNGLTTDGSTPTSTPVAVSGDLSFSALAAGDRHTCGLTTSGSAHCWGSNDNGQLGTGSTASSSTPVPVSGDQIFYALVADGAHTCGLTSSGVAYCWGYNIFGQLGVPETGPETCLETPTESCSTAPVAVSGGLKFSSLTAGTFHSCGVTSSGVAYCWGFNDNGQLGNGSTTSSSTPVPVSGGYSFAVLTGGNAHTCGLMSSGAAYCWGGSDNGQVGDGSFTSIVPTPVAVSGGQSFTVLDAGTVYTCGITPSGAVFCWGGAPLSTVGVIPGGIEFSGIAGGDVHSCGLAVSAVIYCWGENYTGQLGNGTTDDSRVPVLVAGQ